MLHILRKLDGFKDRLNFSLEQNIKNLPENKKKEILAIKEIEKEREALFREFEEESKKLELKYDILMQNTYEKRRNKIQSLTNYPDFWLRVLSNHKIIKDFINDQDRDVLKDLKDLKYTKLDDGLSFKLIFEFEPNDYFTNSVIEKTYNVSREMVIESIQSTKIDWKVGKDLTLKKVVKNVKSKKTGEKKSVERNEEITSFFNFFTNLKTPNEEEIKNLDIETERDLGGHFDTEYEIGLEFVEEIIPYASEFFAAVEVEFDEYHQYASDLINKKF